jgi:hypothetical protein
MSVGSRKLRISSFFVLFGAAVAFAGLVAPGASAAPGDYHVAFVQQPADAGIGDLITSATFDPTGGEEGFVQVEVTQEQFEGPDLPVEGASVSFVLATGTGLATGDLAFDARTTEANGVATFAPIEGSENPLSIDDANNPITSAYRLIPVVTVGEIAPFQGTTPSDGFDIWEDGCSGDDCQVNLTPGALGSAETFTTTESVAMGASTIGAGVTITCPTQVVVFSDEVSFYVTTGDEPVFAVTHISRQDMKRIPQNGQKHIGWCVGLKDPGPWNFAQQDTNGSGGPDSGDFFVGLAPKCPNKRTAPNFAPCILSRMSDDLGGSFISGYLPGGDPTKRT